MTTPAPPRIAIIGAGFGGVAAARALRRAGFTDVTVLEKAATAGGVWRDNVYPGCGCDIPAALYSYSYAPNPDWSRRYPPQSEIVAYLRRCIDDFGLAGSIRYRTEVVDARWDGGTATWRLRCADGVEVTADVLVPAVGQLSRPHLPAVPGADTFAGPAMHTARWDAGVAITGARVGVIGTGASTIQLVPAIAGVAARVTVFQRTPPWLLARPDHRYGRRWRALARRMPATMLPERAATWFLTVAAGRAVTGHPIARALLRTASRTQLRWQVRAPRLRAKLTPAYPLGCKRVLFSGDFLPALRRPDVRLVTDPVVEITAAGVRTGDGTRYDCDVLVYGTGFEASAFLAPLDVTGAGGVRLAEVWRDGAYAYLGLAVPDFPNMFLMYGPNTNTGNTSVIYFHEAQARYLAQAVARIARSGAVAVRPEVADAFDAEMRSRLAGGVWTGCTSWYRAANGRVVTNWPGSAGEYRRRTARFDHTDYRPA